MMSLDQALSKQPLKKQLKIFLAGIMQGSHVESLLHGQDYRVSLKTMLQEAIPLADIYDPLADHQNSLDYQEDHGKSVFLGHNQLCTKVDVLIAFTPEASMGTAIEMWEAYRHRKVVISISPMIHNWAVRFLSHLLYKDLETFQAALRSGLLVKEILRIQELLAQGSPLGYPFEEFLIRSQKISS